MEVVKSHVWLMPLTRHDLNSGFQHAVEAEEKSLDSGYGCTQIENESDHQRIRTFFTPQRSARCTSWPM